MSDENPFGRAFAGPDLPSEDEYVPVTVVEEAPPRAAARRAGTSRRRLLIHLLLFVATCGSTFLAGLVYFGPRGGLTYSLLIMTILACHEMGHYLQARRYGVRATLPFFLPMPLSPLGTLGAVIAMEPRIGDRKVLFDIGVTGPLAGLVPTLVCCAVGVQMIDQPAPVGEFSQQYGDPLLLELMYWWRFGPLPAGWDVPLNPFLWAGWVGLLVTSLNLIPIGQLDGGHILYAMIRKPAHRLAKVFLYGAILGVVVGGYWYPQVRGWWLMLLLLAWMGPKHPPTANDHAPLGSWRYVLGWLTLAFIVIGFTPRPFIQL